MTIKRWPLYHELVRWYRLVDPPEEHRDEAASYQAALERAASPAPETLLELGAGAGHNAVHLKRRFRCTLLDLSPDMSRLSRELNPECDHVVDDMRTARLGRAFDTVLVHDALMYMTTAADLLAAMRTAYAHLRPGGAAVFAPDCFRETFDERADTFGGAAGSLALQGLEWSWDPDPRDETFRAEFSLLLRDGTEMKAVHDSHLCGLFPRATWWRLLEEAGFTGLEMVARPLDEDGSDEVILARRG